MPLVRIVKNWDFPDLFRQTPQGAGWWGEFRFTMNPVEECDYLVFLNNAMGVPITACCPEENIWAIMQEPFQPGHTDWMAEGHDFFAKVFTHSPPSAAKKYVRSQPALPWHVNKSYDALTAMPIPQKTNDISWVVGNADTLPGHAKRFQLLREIQRSRQLPIHLYGRAVQPIEDKWDGLAPYKYSLAIENSSSPDYWTEKLADCFLSCTVPIYFGCPNIADYFPEESFIRLDIADPGRCVEDIKAVLAEDDWEKRLPALQEARKLVLNKYQFFPFITEQILARSADTAPPVRQTIPPYKRSLKAKLYKVAYSMKRRIHG